MYLCFEIALFFLDYELSVESVIGFTKMCDFYFLFCFYVCVHANFFQTQQKVSRSIQTDFLLNTDGTLEKEPNSSQMILKIRNLVIS